MEYYNIQVIMCKLNSIEMFLHQTLVKINNYMLKN